MKIDLKQIRWVYSILNKNIYITSSRQGAKVSAGQEPISERKELQTYEPMISRATGQCDSQAKFWCAG